MTDRVAVLRDKVRRAEEGGGLERRERQHREGRLTARERVEILLDEGSLEELDKLVRKGRGLAPRLFVGSGSFREAFRRRSVHCDHFLRGSPASFLLFAATDGSIGLATLVALVLSSRPSSGRV